MAQYCNIKTNSFQLLNVGLCIDIESSQDLILKEFRLLCLFLVRFLLNEKMKEIHKKLELGNIKIGFIW